MRKQYRAVAGGVLAFALALGSAGCTGSRAGADSEYEDEFALVDINQVEREELRRGGTFHWPVADFPTQWNSYHIDGGKVATSTVLGALMPRLWQYDQHAVPRPDPAYLQEAEVTSDDPKQQVTYTLHPGAKWSDGRSIGVRDFQAQWKALNGRDQRFRYAASQGYDRIESVEKGEEPRQVVVTFAEPFGPWRALFDPLYPATMMSDPDVFNKGWIGDIPVTAGPFRLDRIDAQAKTVTVERNPRWWGRSAVLDRIVFRAMSADDELEAFDSGKVDFMTVGTNAATYKRVKSIPETSIRKAAAPEYSVITFNATSPMLQDVNVRKAIAMSIDRAAIATSALSSVEWPAEPMENHFFVNTQSGYEANSGVQQTVDRAQARELLDKAGWKKKGKARVKKGRKLAVEFIVPSDSPRSEQVGTMVRNMLAKVDIRVSLPTVPIEDFFDKYVTTGNYDLAPSAWRGTPFPVASSRSIYVNPTKDDRGNPVIQQNYARVGSPQIDEAMNAAIATLDPDDARARANQADRLIWDEVHSLPIYQQPQIRATKEDLANFGAPGLRSIVYEDIGFVEEPTD